MTTTSVDRLSGLAASIAMKAPCRVATTANITRSGLQTIDGVALAEGDRVLVKNQTTGSQNGIYDASSGAWTRSADLNSSDDVRCGTQVWVTHGTTNGVTEFVLTTANPIDLDTTSLTWAPSLSTQGLATLAMFENPTFTGDMEITNTDDGAGGGPYYRARRLSPSPADNDVGASFIWSFYNDALIEFNGAFMTAVLIDASQGTEDVRLQLRTVVAGVEATRWNWEDAMWSHVATGGKKTAGSMNVVDFYVQGAQKVDPNGGVHFKVLTSTNIADINHACNTTYKEDGVGVWDTSNNRLMIAGGSSANSVWYSAADPATTVTPS